jgi:CHAT domain-containing protein
MGSWSAAAASTRAALFALAVVLAGAAPIACVKPQTVLWQAAELAKTGKLTAALYLLETFLTNCSRRLSDFDSAVLHLKAASDAGSAGEPEKARDHLEEVVRLLPAYMPAPQWHARLAKEAAEIFVRIGDFGSAESLLTSSGEELVGVNLSEAADAVNQLGMVELELLRAKEACSTFEKSLDLSKRAELAEDRRVPVLYNLVTCQLQSGELTKARTTLKILRASSAIDPALRPLTELAEAQILLREANLKQAGIVLRAVVENTKEDDPVRAHALFLLATARFDRGLTREAAEAGFAAAAAYRTTLGDWHPVLARTFHLLGNTYEELWDFSSAEDYFAKAAEIERRNFGSRSLQFEATEIERGWLELRTGHTESADRRARRAVEFLEHSPVPDRRREGLAHILVGLVAEAKDSREEAVEHYLAGQQLIEITNGPQSPDLTFSLVRLGRLLTLMGRHQEAGAKLDRAIAIYHQLGSRWSVRLADALTARADLHAALGDQDAELKDSRKAFALLKERLAVPDGTAEGFADSQRYSERELLALHAIRLVRLAQTHAELYVEAFAATQEALTSRAGEALRRTMQRFSLENTELARLVGDREDAGDSLREIDLLLSRELTKGALASSKEEMRLRQLRREKVEDLRRLTDLVRDKLPEMAQFEHPVPVELSAVQRVLSDDEAALITVTSEHQSLLWAVRRDGFTASITSSSASELGDLVAESRKSITSALDREPGAAVPQFDRDQARRLYEAVIFPIASDLKGKSHIIYLPDSALQKIPLHIALDGKTDKWLIERYAITTVPSLRAFLAARDWHQPSRAAKEFLGVGAPDFSAYSRASVQMNDLSTAALKDMLARLQPLPEAASELHQMGSLFPWSEVTLDLGSKATKSEFRSAPPSGYRIIVFATHAVMAGEAGLDEPAIVLYPDGKSVSDGLLTASEIALLRLDADLVVLSACNTAAPDGGPYAEGLSGLARAFMHAGARSMLVSHWAAPRKSTPMITTGFMAAIQRDRTVRKAEALRAAILSLLGSGDDELEHPAYWAPFVIVGE